MDKKAIEGGNMTRTIVYDLGSKLSDEAPVFARLTSKQQVIIDRTIDQMMVDTYNEDGGVQAEKDIDMSWLERTACQW